jgi:two-component system, cell cycle sensor histidine kinase and response regulator CckA
MAQSLRILLVEDDSQDTALVVRELRRAGFEPDWKRVDTKEDYLDSLHAGLDIIISDYSLPQFGGVDALELLKESGLEIPFMIVSGTIGEETAVEAMKLGASDYLLKDRLARLGPAVRQALEQSRRRNQHKQAVEALQRTSKLLQTIFDSAPVAILGLDLQGRVIRWNAGAYRMFGWTEGEVIGRVCPTVPEDHLLQYLAMIERAAHEGGQTGMIDLRRKKNGEMIYTSVVSAALHNGVGETVGVMAIIEDISARRRTEEELKLREASLVQAQRIAHLGSWSMELIDMEDISENPLRWSDEMFSLLGYEPGRDKATIDDFFERVHPEDRDKVKIALGETLREGSPFEVEHRIVLPDGTERIIHEEADLIRDSQTGRVLRIVGTVQDITKQRQSELALRTSEEQLRQSQKMEAIGQLSSGVAHDFNNLLTVIKGHLDLFRIKGQISPKMISSVKQINHAADRASTLTRQLLMFSRQQVMQQADYNLNGLVSNLSKMLRRLLTEKIVIQVNYAARPLMIRADEGMVEQVLLNLAINARDAMVDGGTLTISTEPVDFNKTSAARVAQARPGKFVCLQITDSGSGIPDETLPRIFEPFFTTKEVGKGTGLGLAMVYGIMQQHNGWVSVESEVGAGTTFRAYFPRLDSATITPFEEKGGSALPGGHEGILLVEDEAAVRQIAEAALVSLGYRVFSAPSGRAALQVWDTHKQSIELLVTDLIMPEGIGGRELAVLLLAENPQLPVVYMSGYSNEVASEEFQLEEGVNYLAKPFDLAGFSKIIRASLNRAAIQEPLGRPSG